MSNRPWMPFYFSDYLADTSHLSTTEHGAYFLLIAHYWSNGGLPNDEAVIARITRMTARQWSKSRDLLRSLFGDNWCHKRIDKELAKVIEKSQVNSANAKRRYSERKPDAQRTDTHSHPHSDSERQEEGSSTEVSRETTDLPSSGSQQVAAEKYAFEGRVVKLTQRNFEQWRRAYSNINLAAELIARDAWLWGEASPADRKNWFVSTSKYLANRDGEAMTKLAGMPRTKSGVIRHSLDDPLAGII